MSDRDELSRMIKDAYYHARDHGGTMHTAGDDAAEAILASEWLAKRDARIAIEAVSQNGSVVEVHHHDIEKRAEHYNEGFEDAVAQGLADDPAKASDWLRRDRARERAEALEKYAASWDEFPNDALDAEMVRIIQRDARRDAERIRSDAGIGGDGDG